MRNSFWFQANFITFRHLILYVKTDILKDDTRCHQMTMILSQVKGMVDYRHLVSNENMESILYAFQELNKADKLVSSDEIEQYLRETKGEAAQNVYYNGKKNSKSMSLRTIQRHLRKLVGTGLVIKKNNKYILSSIGKRRLQFRNFASGYGNMALNNIMDCHFPTISSLEENLDRLIEIFGLYIIYCLIEATRLIVAADNNQSDHWRSYYFGHSSNFNKDGKFKEEQLVSSWIKDVFNPLQMLNLFLTTISNVSRNEKIPKKKTNSNNNKKQNIALEEYRKHYGELAISPNSTILSDNSNNNNKEKRKGRKTTPAPTLLDLALQRGLSAAKSRSTFNNSFDNTNTLGSSLGENFNQMLKLITDYSNQGNLLYELDNKKILEVKDILKKRYPVFSKYLQKTDEYFYSKYPS
jgi:hypothetical protein